MPVKTPFPYFSFLLPLVTNVLLSWMVLALGLINWNLTMSYYHSCLLVCKYLLCIAPAFCPLGGKACPYVTITMPPLTPFPGHSLFCPGPHQHFTGAHLGVFVYCKPCCSATCGQPVEGMWWDIVWGCCMTCKFNASKPYLVELPTLNKWCWACVLRCTVGSLSTAQLV